MRSVPLATTRTEMTFTFGAFLHQNFLTNQTVNPNNVTNGPPTAPINVTQIHGVLTQPRYIAWSTPRNTYPPIHPIRLIQTPTTISSLCHFNEKTLDPVFLVDSVTTGLGSGVPCLGCLCSGGLTMACTGRDAGLDGCCVPVPSDRRRSGRFSFSGVAIVAH